MTTAEARRRLRYKRPTGPLKLRLEPRLASWDAAGHPSQVRLARFLDHIEGVVAPVTAGIAGGLAAELVIGLPREVSLIEGGRDLDNYLLPVARRIGAARLAAVFGRKVHGASTVAVAEALPAAFEKPAQFSTAMVGSPEKADWKQRLRAELIRSGAELMPAGPVAVDVAITTGLGRNWANLWKPLLDAFGPVLGESPGNPFNPRDDRVVSLGLHHHVDAALGYAVVIDVWWGSAATAAEH